MRVALQAHECARFAWSTHGHIMKAEGGIEPLTNPRAFSCLYSETQDRFASVKKPGLSRKHSVVGRLNLVHADQILLHVHLH